MGYGGICWLNVLKGGLTFFSQKPSLVNQPSVLDLNLDPEKRPYGLGQSVEYTYTESPGENQIEAYREEYEFIDEKQEGLQV